jgi:hypothetical protein
VLDAIPLAVPGRRIIWVKFPAPDGRARCRFGLVVCPIRVY